MASISAKTPCGRRDQRKRSVRVRLRRCLRGQRTTSGLGIRCVMWHADRPKTVVIKSCVSGRNSRGRSFRSHERRQKRCSRSQAMFGSLKDQRYVAPKDRQLQGVENAAFWSPPSRRPDRTRGIWRSSRRRLTPYSRRWAIDYAENGQVRSNLPARCHGGTRQALARSGLTGP